MKIATWNLERLKHRQKADQICRICDALQADIFVLTETDAHIALNAPYCFHTPTPPEVRLPPYETPLHYRPTEHRVSIFTKFPCVRQHETFDPYTALCVELQTPEGNLLVYGTIMGVFGNRRPSYLYEVAKQSEDIQRLSGLGALCVCGDFNCSFSDSYYYTKAGRTALQDVFAKTQIELLTAKCPACIDHIAISKRCLNRRCVQIEAWNLDKTLSDHKGIAVTV